MARPTAAIVSKVMTKIRRWGIIRSYRSPAEGATIHAAIMVEPSSQSSPRCLIYDGRCRMCVTAKDGLERMNSDKELVRMITYQSAEAKQLLGSQYRAGRPDAAFLVSANGEIARGLDAFLPLLPGLKGGRLLAGLFTLPLVRPFGYWLYKLVAKYRYKLFGEVPLSEAP